MKPGRSRKAIAQGKGQERYWLVWRKACPFSNPRRYHQSLTKAQVGALPGLFPCSRPIAAAGPHAQAHAQHGHSTALAANMRMGKWDPEKFYISGLWTSRVGEDKYKLLVPETGLIPQRDGAEPSSCRQDIRHLGTVLCFCSNTLCHNCSKCLSRDSMEEPYLYCNSISTSLSLLKTGVTSKFSFYSSLCQPNLMRVPLVASVHTLMSIQ